MTDVNTTLPPALRRALDLLADPPAEPDVSNGYLDLLGAGPDSRVPKNTGAIQAIWTSPIGSMLYDNAQTVARRLLAVWQHPIEWLNIPPGWDRAGRRLRSGDGDRITGPGCGSGRTGARCRHFRADAGTGGPRRVRTAGRVFAGRCATFAAAQQHGRCGGLDRGPAADTGPGGGAVGDRPGAATGGTAGGDGADRGRAARLWRMLPNTGAYAFGEDEIGDILEEHGFASVRTKNVGTFQWVRGRR